MTVGNMGEFFSTLVFDSWSGYAENSPGVPFPFAMPKRGKTVIVEPRECL
jgi:hypothetical protein